MIAVETVDFHLHSSSDIIRTAFTTIFLVVEGIHAHRIFWGAAILLVGVLIRGRNGKGKLLTVKQAQEDAWEVLSV